MSNDPKKEHIKEDDEDLIFVEQIKKDDEEVKIEF